MTDLIDYLVTNQIGADVQPTCLPYARHEQPQRGSLGERIFAKGLPLAGLIASVMLTRLHASAKSCVAGILDCSQNEYLSPMRPVKQNWQFMAHPT